jgi:uncharacterized protein (TIGR03435 family)
MGAGKMRNLSIILVAVMAATAVAQPAKSAPAFEVATIKLGTAGGNFVEVTPGALVVHSGTLITCIMWAYDVQFRQVVGVDSTVSRLLDSQRYDIVAKPAGHASEAQLKLMLQTLLADRFKLSLHRESREMQTYAMVVAKNGVKFHESQGEGQSAQDAKSKLVRRWQFTTMAQFADNISGAMEAPISDQTGLSGKYDLALDLTPYMPTAPQPEQRPDIASMMVTAIQEQLGLKLEAKKMPREVLAVDHLEKPTEN